MVHNCPSALFFIFYTFSIFLWSINFYRKPKPTNGPYRNSISCIVLAFLALPVTPNNTFHALSLLIVFHSHSHSHFHIRIHTHIHTPIHTPVSHHYTTRVPRHHSCAPLTHTLFWPCFRASLPSYTHQIHHTSVSALQTVVTLSFHHAMLFCT